MHEDDLQLAKAVAKGDKAAFEQFFSCYFPRLFRFAMARTGGDESLAEEMAQTTLCNVMRKLDGFRGEASLFTWLCQICRNEIARNFKKADNDPNRRMDWDDNDAVVAALESLSAGAFDPEQTQHRSDTARLVQVVLDYLPERYALVLEMKYLKGERVSTIAAHLGIGEKAAESTLTRARASFRDGFHTLWGIDHRGPMQPPQ